MQALDRVLTPIGDPIMTAKFLLPVVNAPVLERRRLLELLTACVAGPVTLISAPAGSGKSVLASSWAAAGVAPGPVVWISLDEEDDLPGVFWTYVVTGLARSGVDVGGVGASDDAEDVDHSLLVRLAARLCERADPVVLIFDNAEAITRQQICDQLDFLVRHAAGRVRLVVVTRVDPRLPLPQYRLEGMVSEIGFRDLAFQPDEARQLLAARRPELSDAAVQAFSYRTRGWAAGLRLADLPLQGDDEDDVDPAVLVASDIAVYFRSEVLHVQPTPVRDFLLATSVVDHLSPELASHLSAVREAGATVRALAQSSAFVEAVPGEEDAFRYHPLVRDLLTAQLRQESPVRWRRLNRKAAQWMAREGRTVEAVRHFAIAGDWDDAAAVLIRQRGLARLLAGGPSDALAVALTGMPIGVAGPQGAVASAALAVVSGDLDACDKSLARAREVLAGTGAEHALELELAAALTALARSAAAGGVGGDEAAEAAELAVGRVGARLPVDAVTGALVTYGRGCVELAWGDLAAGRRSLAAAAREAQDAGYGVLAGRCLARLALGEAVSGRLTDAVEAAQAAAELEPDRGAGEQDGPTRVFPAVTAALAWVASERGELTQALADVRRIGAGPRRNDDLVVAGVVALVRCRLLRARGDLAGALAALDGLSFSVDALPLWLEQRVAAAGAGVLIALGRPEAAVERLQHDVVDEAADCLLALGWAKLALGAAAEGTRLARQVMQRPSVPVDLQVGAHLLAAAGALALGHGEQARAAVDEAVRLAAPERVRRPFDEAPPRIKALLEQRRQHPCGATPAPTGGATAGVPSARRPEDVIVQPLTEREREVLGYLDALLPTEEIAARMFVSVNTVKTHVRAILRKLSADRRNEAVRRARELGLV
ncbi:MAG: LuxR C-terminal-related transcriptional regulator [Kineosporiaceae bacterium]